MGTLEDVTDDKLPHDVAEQLRLLSSHFKEVENHQLNQHSNVLDDADVTLQNIDGDNDDSASHVLRDHVTDDPNMKMKNDSDISDENIQPELRGQWVNPPSYTHTYLYTFPVLLLYLMA